MLRYQRRQPIMLTVKGDNMKGKPKSVSSVQKKINTLGESGTGNYEKQGVILKGTGSELSQKNYRQNRGKRKLIAAVVSRDLADIAKSKGRDDMVNSFWHCYYCQSILKVHDGKSYGYYCKQRFCPICSSIRKAELINKYKPIIEKWDAPYFVTLTVMACKAQGLNNKLKKVKTVFELITKRFKQRYKRGKGIKVMGVRSIECNFNPSAKTYNPHIHLIVPNKEVANLLMSSWLMHWGVWEATGGHQDKREINDIEHDLVETIKYGTKFFTEPNPRDKKKIPRSVYLRAMYNIIVSMRNMKQFHSFGFILPKQTIEKQPSRVVVDWRNFEYNLESWDWIDEETGNPLTAYAPDNELIELLNERIDIEAE